MTSLILQTAARMLVAVMLLFSIFLLLRGHDEPGGGFIGGLVAAAAVPLYSLAFDVPYAPPNQAVNPQTIIS
jgi:multicomponent Na+:H+ antiporter subunit B